MIGVNFCNCYFKFIRNCLVNSVHYSSGNFFFETICLAQRKPPIKLLCPKGDQSASLNNVKRQGTRSRVSYSAKTTQWHFYISPRDRLKHFKTTCVNALALRSDKPEIETKWSRHDSAVRSPIAPQEIHKRAQVKALSQQGAYQQRVYGIVKLPESL